MKGDRPGPAQSTALVVLRTLVGWHLLYEGLVKVWLPAWGRDGSPLAVWSAGGYLRAANGPFAGLFHAMADSHWLPALDTAVAVALIAAGLSLMLGLFTQSGAGIALLLLASFYASNVPLAGVPTPGAEGVYLFVDKNLVEAAAVFVLLVFRTGRIAGLDLWLRRGREADPVGKEPAA
jgi:thiosulfate dehydrogenase [quinone] large subunit